MGIGKTLIMVLALAMSTNAMSADYLFKGGKSGYTIVLPDDASQTERTAAHELQSIVKKIGGVTLPILSKPSSKNIYVGWNGNTGKPKPATDDEGYTYETKDANLYIYGGSERGTMYGVYSFLERELGVRWYTSSYTKLTTIRQYVLRKLQHSERPAIRRRLDFCYDALRHNDWVAHNLLNSQHQLNNSRYGRLSSYWGIHTFKKLLPPEKYFRLHPEWYSVYKGNRSSKAQLCLSNSNMRKELIRNLKKIIAENPGYWCYDVSQNDNPWPCECASCGKLVKRYGGQSGVMIWFVNQVADEIRKTYSDILIGTFAYLYTRQVPKSNIRVADNVVIRLCNIECCMAHPLETCRENRSFLADMNAWRKITNKIYIWDYTTGFRNYLLPFPNFETLAANYRYFSGSGVIGVMEQGGHNAPWNEFSELKQWLIAKLLWNPKQDVDSLACTFIFDYYGSAATYVWQYYKLCKRLVASDTHFTIKIDSQSPLYTEQFITEGQSLMKKALAVVSKSSAEYKRTQRIAAQLYYLKLYRHKLLSAVDGTRQALQDILATDPTIAAEWGCKMGELK